MSHVRWPVCRSSAASIAWHGIRAALCCARLAGSLGQGLGIAVGEALAVKRIHDIPTRVFVLLGDSECAEGR